MRRLRGAIRSRDTRRMPRGRGKATFSSTFMCTLPDTSVDSALGHRRGGLKLVADAEAAQTNPGPKLMLEVSKLASPQWLEPRLVNRALTTSKIGDAESDLDNWMLGVNRCV
jgi:hypothetical protein